MKFISQILPILMIMSSCSSLKHASAETSDKVFPKFFKEIDSGNLKKAREVLKDNEAGMSPGGFNIKFRGQERNIFSTLGNRKHDYKNFIKRLVIIKSCSTKDNPKRCYENNVQSKISDKRQTGRRYIRKSLSSLCEDYCMKSSGHDEAICVLLGSPTGRAWKPGQSFKNKVCGK